MAKFKEIAIATFEKPKNCWECPCSYFTEGVSSDYCALKFYNDGKEDECDIEEYVGDIPAWCPLDIMTFMEETLDA